MSELKKPLLLKPGDKVAIVAPSSRIEADYIEKSISVFEDWGLIVEKGKHLLTGFHQFSGTDAQRLEDFQHAIDSEEVKAIICARGGYGAIRLLDKISWIKFAQNPKWLVGFSDVSAFHFSIQNMGIQSIHAIMPINIGKLYATSREVELLGQAIFDGKIEYELPTHKLNVPGTEIATVVGGNLSILHALAATSYGLDLTNKILFIEDVGEKYYHLDRMMQSLRLSGKLDSLSGLIVGGLSEMTDNKRPFGKSPEEIVSEVVQGFDFPVVFGFPAGHITNNEPIILGAKTALEVTPDFVKIRFS